MNSNKGNLSSAEGTSDLLTGVDQLILTSLSDVIMEPLKYSVNQYLLSSFYVPSMSLGNGDSALNQTIKNPGTWVAQWVKDSAFGSGHDLRVLGSSPESGSLLSGEPASSSLSACLSAYL